MNEELLKEAIEALLSDIESMQITEEGEFGEFSEAGYGRDGYWVEWPNLAISARRVRELMGR